MNVHIQHAVDGYSVEWFDKGRTGRDYEPTILGAVARVSQLLRGDDRAEDDWVRAQGGPDYTPCVAVLLTDGSSGTYEADEAHVSPSGALTLFLGVKTKAIFASGTWRKALSQ